MFILYCILISTKMKSKYKFGLHSFSLAYIFGAYIIFLPLFITSYHKLSCANLLSLLSYSSWGQKSYMVLSHWTQFPSGRSWEESSSSSFPGSRGYPHSFGSLSFLSF